MDIRGSLLVIFLSLAGSLEISAQILPDEKLVVATVVDVSIDSALLVLSENSKVSITYDPAIIPPKKVSLAVHNIKLGVALDNVFQGTTLAYKIVGNVLVIQSVVKGTAQHFYNISGVIYDSLSLEKLVYANIYTDGVNVYGNVSNENGFYSISIPENQYSLHFSYLGYETKVVRLNLSRDTVINAYLHSEQLLNEIVIRESFLQKSTATEQSVLVPTDLLSNMANIGGEPDIFRMIQMRAGVSSFTDGFGGVQVRGGQSDHTLSLMDGIPVYNTGHMLGLYSIFNPSTIKSTRLIKGGMPARYGGRLGAVLDVVIKDGNKNIVAGDLSISPLLARASLEIPIIKEKSSLMIAGRRTIVDPFLKPLSAYQFDRNNETGFINFYFYDINAKWNIALSKNDNFYVNFYKGEDRYRNEVEGETDISNVSVRSLDQTEYNWGNQLTSFKWTHMFGKRAFLSTRYYLSSFSFQNFEFDRTIFNPGATQALGYNAQLHLSDISDRGANVDIDIFVRDQLKLRLGSELINHVIKPGGSFIGSDNRLLNSDFRLTSSQLLGIVDFPTLDGREWRNYIETEWRFKDRFTANVGLHFASLSANKASYRFAQPRIGLAFRMASNHFFRLGYSQTDQFMHVLSSFGFGLPNDVWIASTDRIKPQRSQDYSAEFEFNFLSGYSINFSAYRKSMSNIYAFREGGIFSIQSTLNWEESLQIGTGQSRGIEFEVEKKLGKIRGFMSYTLSESTRIHDGINRGQRFYANNDRRHQASINVQTVVNENLDLTVGFTYGSGSPLTLPLSVQTIIVNNVVEILPIYGNINNARFPAYHNLNLGMNVHNKYTWARQKFSIGVYNAYNRRNPFYIDIVKDRQNENRFTLESVSLMPFLPYISYGLSF